MRARTHRGQPMVVAATQPFQPLPNKQELAHLSGGQAPKSRPAHDCWGGAPASLWRRSTTIPQVGAPLQPWASPGSCFQPPLSLAASDNHKVWLVLATKGVFFFPFLFVFFRGWRWQPPPVAILSICFLLFYNKNCFLIYIF